MNSFWSWRQQHVSKKFGKKGVNGCGTKAKQLEDDFATNWVDWQQLSNITGYKKNILVRQSYSGVNVGRGSPVCKKTVHMQTVEQFQNNDPKHNIAKTISSSTVHNVIKKLRVSEHKGQTWKSVWDTSNLPAAHDHL